MTRPAETRRESVLNLSAVVAFVAGFAAETLTANVGYLLYGCIAAVLLAVASIVLRGDQ